MTEGGKVCDGMGKCVACVADDNCGSAIADPCNGDFYTVMTVCNSGACKPVEINCGDVGKICTPMGCAPCVDNFQCGPPQGDCKDRKCDSGTCGNVNHAQGSGCPSIVNGTCVADGTCVARKYVFVSADLVDSSFGGTKGADDTCAAAANFAGLGGTWMSWTSDGGSSPSARFTHSPAPYVLLDDVTTVAMNWQALISGTLTKSISLTEKKDQVLSPLEVWTATDPSGHYTPSACNDWTLVNGLNIKATVGMAGSTDIGWTDAKPQLCISTAHLYCFQQ